MKVDARYGDIMKLAEAYANETAAYVKGSGKPGALADAHDVLQKVVSRIEYLAFKNPPCKICVNVDAPPVGPPCCDCVETTTGWSGFVQARVSS